MEKGKSLYCKRISKLNHTKKEITSLVFGSIYTHSTLGMFDENKHQKVTELSAPVQEMFNNFIDKEFGGDKSKFKNYVENLKLNK